MNLMRDKTLLTVAEAARILGLRIRTVQRMALTGQLPAEQKLPGPRGAYLFKRAAVEAARDR